MGGFVANVAVCPHCGKSFVHNKVNGVALVQAISDIEMRKKMYCRLTLDSLERAADDGKLTFPLIKKVVLDNFNDLTRDIHTILGYGEEAE